MPTRNNISNKSWLWLFALTVLVALVALSLLTQPAWGNGPPEKPRGETFARGSGEDRLVKSPSLQRGEKFAGQDQGAAKTGAGEPAPANTYWLIVKIEPDRPSPGGVVMVKPTPDGSNVYITTRGGRLHYAPGTVITLWADPSPGYELVHFDFRLYCSYEEFEPGGFYEKIWDKCVDRHCLVTSDTVRIRMDSNMWIRAVFRPTSYVLDLTVDPFPPPAGPGGEVTLSPPPPYSSGTEVKLVKGQHFYKPDTKVTLTAKGYPGWRFKDWDVINIGRSKEEAGYRDWEEESSSPTITITMDEDKRVIAHFEADVYTLVVDVPYGEYSKVSVLPELPGASAVVTRYYKKVLPKGTRVKLQAIPISEETTPFDYWSKDASGSDNPKTITVNSDMHVQANFKDLGMPYLNLRYEPRKGGTVKATPEGHSVTPDSVHDVSLRYGYKKSVTLEPQPSDGYVFSHWSGDIAGAKTDGDRLIVIMDQASKSITAHFKEVGTYDLTVTCSVGGSVNLSSERGSYVSPPGETRTGRVTIDTTVTLKAVAEEGYTFTGWGDDASGSSSPITITMDSDKSVSAYFEKTAVEIPEMTGKPSITPSVISGRERVTVSVPVTTDTNHVAIRLMSPATPEDMVVVMTYTAGVLGQSVVEIETPWVSANIGETLYLTVYVIATDEDVYSHYYRDPSKSTTHYTVYQTDGAGGEYTGLTTIPIAELESTG